jgi:hypothetical protein
MRNLIDRLWGKLSGEISELRRKADLWDELQERIAKEAEHAKTHCCGCDMPRGECVCDVT